MGKKHELMRCGGCGSSKVRLYGRKAKGLDGFVGLIAKCRKCSSKTKLTLGHIIIKASGDDKGEMCIGLGK